MENNTSNFSAIRADIKQYIETNRTEACSSGFLGDHIRQYFMANKSEYSKLLKLYKNDLVHLCTDMISEINNEFASVPVENKDAIELEQQARGISYQIDRIKQSRPDINELQDKAILSLMAEMSKLLDKRDKLPKFVEKDLRYKTTSLTTLLNDVLKSLSEIAPDATPSDEAQRAKVVFNKHMSLEEALFTILWNTRGQTLPISVMNIKAWAARFVERLGANEQPRTNLPTMLIFRSRTNHGTQSGNTGKSRIAGSCLKMLADKGLNVTNPRSPATLPTYERVDKQMSDKTMVLMEDINYNNFDSETMNKFLDGQYIKNRGKYEREGFIFPFGNVLATTNYDMQYGNNNRYPVIEFDFTDARIAVKDPVVQKHAKFKCDQINDIFDYSDAWETLFSYAKDNSSQWLEEYALYRRDAASKCSTQRNKLEELVLACLDEMLSVPYGTGETFRPREVLDTIKRLFPYEIKNCSISSIISVLRNLHIEQANTTLNPYQMSFTYPTQCELLALNTQDPSQQTKWDWILNNAAKNYPQQKDI